MPQCPRQAGAALPAPFPLYISPVGLRQQGGGARYAPCHFLPSWQTRWGLTNLPKKDTL